MSARRSIIPLFVPHWGCPHDCVFCNQRHISGRKEPVTAAQVEEALAAAAAIPAPEGRELAFYGGSFTAIPAAQQEALLRPAFQAKQAGFLSGVRLSTRPDCIDEAVLARLSAFGVSTIELGAQSMDDRVLRLAGRGHGRAATVKAAAAIRERGFSLILQMMTGLPGDGPEGARATARALAALAPDGVRIYPAVVVRDTALHTLWQEGRYRPQSLEEAVELCADLLDIFEAAGIPVIRLGLSPTRELEAAAAAGPYHPAFGELCQSRRLRREAERLIGASGKKDLLLTAPKGRLSAAIGQKRENLRYLQEKFSLHSLRIREGEGSRLLLEEV